MNLFQTLRSNKEHLTQAYNKTYQMLSTVAENLQETLQGTSVIKVGNPVKNEILIVIDGHAATVDLSHYDNLADLLLDIRNWSFRENTIPIDEFESLMHTRSWSNDVNQQLIYQLVILSRQLQREYIEITAIKIKSQNVFECTIESEDDVYTHELHLDQFNTMDDIRTTLNQFVQFVKDDIAASK